MRDWGKAFDYDGLKHKSNDGFAYLKFFKGFLLRFLGTKNEGCRQANRIETNHSRVGKGNFTPNLSQNRTWISQFIRLLSCSQFSIRLIDNLKSSDKINLDKNCIPVSTIGWPWLCFSWSLCICSISILSFDDVIRV